MDMTKYYNDMENTAEIVPQSISDENPPRKFGYRLVLRSIEVSEKFSLDVVLAARLYQNPSHRYLFVQTENGLSIYRKRDVVLGPEFVDYSISHATFVDDDLIEAFDAFLTLHDPSFVSERVAESEKADYLNETLFDRLNAIAPAGCYFGAYPGNGSDFGFWKFEDVN